MTKTHFDDSWLPGRLWPSTFAPAKLRKASGVLGRLTTWLNPSDSKNLNLHQASGSTKTNRWNYHLVVAFCNFMQCLLLEVISYHFISFLTSFQSLASRSLRATFCGILACWYWASQRKHASMMHCTAWPWLVFPLVAHHDGHRIWKKRCQKMERTNQQWHQGVKPSNKYTWRLLFSKVV